MTLSYPEDRTSSVVDLDALFRAYSNELNSFAFRKLRDRDAAEDVVQDGFLRFLTWRQNHQDVSFTTSPRFYLWRIVGNLVVDFVRGKHAKARFSSIDDYANLLVDPNPTADRFVEARQQLAVLKAVLDEMTYEQRTILLLNRMDGLTHEQIARKMGLSTSMVCKHIVAALYRCMKGLAKYGS